MQVKAIMIDSLRHLRSSSLFWITLALSLLSALLLFGLVNFDENGWSLLWFATNESDILKDGSPAAESLVSWLFGGAMMWWWLTWIAIVIALLSTASIMPEFMSSGAIDVTLAKPISRVKLFLTKFAGSMLFMLVQVLIAVGVGYILCGVRFGYWFHAAWLAVPLVVLQFLYLYAIMTLFAMITRSTLASLLGVLVVWGLLSVVQFASNQMDAAHVESQTRIALTEKRIADLEQAAASEDRELTSSEESRIRRWRDDLSPYETSLRFTSQWKTPVNALELLIPKTGDIQKIIADQMDAPTFAELVFILQGGDPEMLAAMMEMQDEQAVRDMQEAGIEGERAARSVNVPVSIATSLGFTAMVMALSTWIFIRRDF